MRKRFISLILGVILCCTMFAGCSLIEHNNTKDARQVVAVIDSFSDESNGVVYTSKEVKIYKSDLINALNSYGESYMSQYGLTLQQATERLLEELVTRELLTIEADRLLEQGYIEWTKSDDNDKKKYIYNTIDNQLASIENEILSEYDESTSTSDDESEESETTYPTPDSLEEENDEDYTYYEKDEKGDWVYEKDESGNFVLDEDGNKIHKIIDWAPSIADYPAMWGDEPTKSREREVVARFVALLKNLAKQDFKVTAEDKRLFAEDDKKIDDVIATKGIEYVYPMLWETHYVEYLVGTSARQSILITKLQDYIVGSVDVDDEEVISAYNTELAYQQETYRADPSAYQSAVSGGNTTILYFLDDSYFYVKHILLPFSDAQTAAMNAWKSNPANAGKDYKVMRDSQMVNETVVYPHVDGENDLDNPTTVDAVFSEIKSAMLPKANTPELAEREFDRLTYKYNTDTGAFGYGSQYAVKKNDDEGHSGYMEEFYDGAMKLYNNYKVGDVLPELVVTDYGVHIMYLSYVPTPNSIRPLNGYLTHGKYKKVYDTFEETIRTAKENNAFTAWQNERITYYQNNEKIVHTYAKRYKSLYE